MKLNYKLDSKLLPQNLIISKIKPKAERQSRWSYDPINYTYYDTKRCKYTERNQNEWEQKKYYRVSYGSKPILTYIKYHKKENVLEFRRLSINATYGGCHEWKDAESQYTLCSFLLTQSKEMIDLSTGNSITNKIFFLRDALKHIPCFLHDEYTNEIKKLTGDSYTISNGNVYEMNYAWRLIHWMQTKQIDQSESRKGKEYKLAETLMSIPLAEPEPIERGDNQNYLSYYDCSIRIEIVNEDWIVARKVRDVYGYGRSEETLELPIELNRLYINRKTGKTRLVCLHKNNEWSLQPNAKYELEQSCDYFPIDVSPLNFHTYLGDKVSLYALQNVMKFPAIEKLIKMGDTSLIRNLSYNNINHISNLHMDLTRHTKEIF